MNKKIVLVLSLILLVLIGAFTTITYAWLTSTGSSDSIDYKVGNIDYTITGPAVEENTFVVPGQTIASDFTIVNKSNIDTNLKVQFTVTVDVTSAKNPQAASTFTIGDSDDDHLLLTLNSDWVLGDDGFLYFGAIDVETLEDVIAANTNPSSPIVGLKLNGDLIGNDYSGAVITIEATFYAKQDAYVTWENLGSINWSTGI